MEPKRELSQTGSNSPGATSVVVIDGDSDSDDDFEEPIRKSTAKPKKEPKKEPSRTTKSESETVEERKVVHPKLFLVYPNLGKLVELTLHMDSYEFLPRIGYRKMNTPFDDSILNNRRGG